jgi:sugar phosphate isomerase/epimerase
VGRINGHNHRLVIEYGDKLNCDGFEIMVSRTWYDRLDTIIREYRSNKLNCPVIHADKDLDDASGFESAGKYMDTWKLNCDFGAEIGAKKIVAHLWGRPDSDKNPEAIYERCGRLLAVAKDYGLDLLVENVVCMVKTPREHLENLARIYPGIGFTIDTRHAQFHAELDRLCESPIWAGGNVRHIHVSEFAGGYKDWSAFRTVPAPGKGDVDYKTFFRHLKSVIYSDSLTLEAPAVQREEGVDVATLNEGLEFIRAGLREGVFNAVCGS